MRAWKLLEAESLYKIQSEVSIHFLESHSTMRWLPRSRHSENPPAMTTERLLLRVLMPEACALTSSEVGSFVFLASSTDPSTEPPHTPALIHFTASRKAQ